MYETGKRRRDIEEEGEEAGRTDTEKEEGDSVTETETIQYIFYLFYSSKSMSIFKLNCTIGRE